MPILRDDHTAALAGIHAQGGELLERIQDVLDQSTLSGPLERLLRTTAVRREALLIDVEMLERERGDLPKAPNTERALLEAIADWVHTQLTDESSLIRRLNEAESQWRQVILDALEQDWTDPEQDVLQALIEHSDEFIDELAVLQTTL
ncbi:hypothetical protein [Saccharospirillum impatiens]|uniref:hypothetical protein n=1 Tax=Saccharospirillum impatiens TaxID=169438 RepID=UPI00041827C9|nr:hypothetical protein [Saccharospirillum impatiens]